MLSPRPRLSLLGLLVLGLSAVMSRPTPAAMSEEVWLIRGARIVPVSRPVIERGSILIRDGAIGEVGTEIAAPEGARVIEGTGLTVYPGLIDLHTTLGQPEQRQEPPRGRFGGGGGDSSSQPMATAA